MFACDTPCSYLLVMREIRVPFVAEVPSGASVDTRLYVTSAEHELLVEVGDFLGSLRAADLVRLSEFQARPRGSVSKQERNAERAARKRDLTAETSSRIANSVNRANNDEWALAWRNVWAARDTLAAQIRVLSQRVAVAPGERADDGTRGYRSEEEREQKRHRLALRRSRLKRAQARIDERRPSICLGGKDRARRRHNLAEAQMSKAAWREDWRASRRFLTFVGTRGEDHGNDTLNVDPDTGVVTLNLPAKYAHMSNVAGPRRLYRFAHPVEFAHRSAEWAARAHDEQPIRYKLRFKPEAKRGKGAWCLTASWAAEPTPTPTLGTLREHPTLGVDVNAGWIAAVSVDADGNPVGRPLTVDTPQEGPTRRRDGQLRAAVQSLLDHAVAHDCASVSVEDLNFADSRDTGRETMGRGRRGKQFRRKVANIPTGKFKDTIIAMAANRGISVIAVDPAYTSKWSRQHRWAATVNCSPDHPCSSHHGAAAVIGRRGLGLAARRSVTKQSMRHCSCPTRPPAEESKARTTVRPRRGCLKGPRNTSGQTRPPAGDKTRNADRGHPNRQRNAKPFGVAQRAPPSAPRADR